MTQSSHCSLFVFYNNIYNCDISDWLLITTFTLLFQIMCKNLKVARLHIFPNGWAQRDPLENVSYLVESSECTLHFKSEDHVVVRWFSLSETKFYTIIFLKLTLWAKMIEQLKSLCILILLIILYMNCLDVIQLHN